MSGGVLQVSAGTGPIEVRRFVAQLAGYLTGVCEEEGAVVREVVVHGEEEAPRSVEVFLEAGAEAAGRFVGTHALVARGEGRGKRARKRWFAGVRLCDEEAGAGAAIDLRDVTITAMRAGGPGGQHVNKTSSAVRVFHAASGVTVRVCDERSQRENVRLGLMRLGRVLSSRAQAEALEARAGRRILHYRLTRGQASFVYELDRRGGLVLCGEICSR